MTQLGSGLCFVGGTARTSRVSPAATLPGPLYPNRPGSLISSPRDNVPATNGRGGHPYRIPSALTSGTDTIINAVPFPQLWSDWQSRTSGFSRMVSCSERLEEKHQSWKARSPVNAADTDETVPGILDRILAASPMQPVSPGPRTPIATSELTCEDRTTLFAMWTSKPTSLLGRRP